MSKTAMLDIRQTFRKRKTVHKNTCNNPNVECHNMPVYRCIRKNGGWLNWSMILIDTLNCENKLEAEKKGRGFIEELHATLNCNMPCRTHEERKQYKKQWSIDHQDENRQKCKEWYDERKDTINQNKKQYRIACECGSEMRRSDLQDILKLKSIKNICNQKIHNIFSV